MGRDPEIDGRPLSMRSLALAFFNYQGISSESAKLWMHATGRLSASERTFVPASEHAAVCRQARSWLAVYALAVAASVAWRSPLPCMFVFLPYSLVGGLAVAALRPGRGATVAAEARAAPPAEPLVLYSYDGNQFCRLVREVLAELDLPYRLRSTGKGSPRRQELLEVAGATTAPYLVDPNTGTSMGESAEICAYLLRTYAD